MFNPLSCSQHAYRTITVKIYYFFTLFGLKMNSKFRRYTFEIDNVGRRVIDDDSNDSPLPVFLELNSIKRYPDLISQCEEEKILSAISNSLWSTSKSNVKKQEYGPKIDFAKHAIDCSFNTGLPIYSRELIKRLRTKSDIDFKPDRLRILEVCDCRSTIVIPWVPSEHHAHQWIFSDTTIIMCLQSDVVICLDEVDLDQSNALKNYNVPTRAEIPLNARSMLILSEKAANLQVNLDATENFTRCILLVYNSIRIVSVFHESCKHQYVDETKRQSKDRLTNRRADIKSSISVKNYNYGVVAHCVEYPSHEFVTTIISADIKG
ncbi:hypothetical protein GJ496_007423 [Pomphorhynchus laevis]|nr:hypothetical protein GJ496_007423 [Pomphorhynchus laevis]